MAIRNIHSLSTSRTNELAVRARRVLEEKLIREHRHGGHPWGSMRRECPLCQASEHYKGRGKY